MKFISFLKVLLIIWPIFLSSCTTIYQVLETKSKDTTVEKDYAIFENNDLKLSYNFWTEGGAMYFILYNKLDSSIYVDWNRSHLIYDGISYDYWVDGETTRSFYNYISYGASSTLLDAKMQNHGSSLYTSVNSTTLKYRQKLAAVSTNRVKPKKSVHIPGHSAIIVSKFSIRDEPFFNCNFNLRKSKNEPDNIVSFNEDNSPLTFRNHLTYSKEESFQESRMIDNSFYISSISFVKEKDFLGKSSLKKYCTIQGTEVTRIKHALPFKKPTNFYLKIIK